MQDVSDTQLNKNNLCELTNDEIDCVSGAGLKQTATAFGLASAIGAATYGSAWGALAVGAAFGAAPIAAIAMVGLAAYGGFAMLRPMNR